MWAGLDAVSAVSDMTTSRRVAIEEKIRLPAHPGNTPVDGCRAMKSSFLGYLPSVKMLPA
jgi:hypothetical protein